MTTALVWMRRDLRLHDSAALYHALRNHERVFCAFVFDTEILDPLLAAGLQEDRRVEFVHGAVQQVDRQLRFEGAVLLVRHGAAREVIPRLAAELQVDAVYANRDYEPAAIARDADVASALLRDGRGLTLCKDQVIFEQDEVLTQAGQPFSVFTPYKNAWLKKLTPFYLKPYPLENYFSRLASIDAPSPLPTLASMGFAPTNLSALRLPVGRDGAQELLRDFVTRIDDYADKREIGRAHV